jgi:hypothetical protein
MLKVLATLNEAQARWFVAREALVRGRGGLKAMHTATGMSRPTILKGIRELQTKKNLAARERIRRPGGGRKRVEALDPGWEGALDRIMDENTAGDPMSLLHWTNKSTARIAEELIRRGHPASDETVRRRLRELGYSLQPSVKTLEEGPGVGRNEQFRYLNRQVKQHLARGQPVLWVDTEKKERVGKFENSGQSRRPQGQPLEANVGDRPHLGEGPAIPHGACDVHRNEGFVKVGMSDDTAEFAVESLRRWWKLFGRRHYPEARRLLVCADGGGSNGSRNRTWKYHLQQFADQCGLEVTFCHYPPGTSEWNKIEHRLFSFLSLDWKGQPLVSYQTVVNLIGATRAKTGRRVKAELDIEQDEAGVEIPDEEMERVHLRPHSTNPLWNYTISPRSRPSRK